MTSSQRSAHVFLATATLILLAGCTAETATPSAAKSGILLANFDKSVRPQDDFFRFVNGSWLAKTEIPADKSNYGTFAMLDDLSEQRVRAIAEAASVASAAKTADADMQRIGDFYASFMDEATIETAGLKPLAAELARIDAIRTPRDLAVVIGHLNKIGVRQPFAFNVSIDEENSSQYVSYIGQRGGSMPDRDYYLADNAKMQATRDKYRAYVRDLLSAAGSSDASAAAERIFVLEKRFAQAQWTRVQNRDAKKTYNRYSIGEAQSVLPNFDWRAFFEGIGAPKIDAVVIAQPSFFTDLGAAFNEVSLAQWREYLRYHAIESFSPYLSARFATLNFEFNGRVITGAAEITPRWKRAVDIVDNTIGELTGKAYVAKFFPASSKARAMELVGNLQQAYAAGIDRLEWMSPETKKKAHEKLAKFTPKIGYPDKWKEWSKLEVRRDDLVGNIIRASSVDTERNIAKLGQPIDRTEWRMTPQTVNAYYRATANEVVFPAAILQPPFFDPTADNAVNYGAIGAVIGHEISHGYDDQGRQFDGDGNLKSWWSEVDDQEFRVRASRLVKEFNGFSPLPEHFVNGELTLGENIADLAGVAMAYQAFKLSLHGKEAPVIDGFTGEQRFFIGYAQVWARRYRDDELRRRLLTDPHSPSEFRVNGIVTNQPGFYSAFGLKEGDKLYRDPKDRVRIW